MRVVRAVFVINAGWRRMICMYLPGEAPKMIAALDGIMGLNRKQTNITEDVQEKTQSRRNAYQ